jgi:hypothetical protein
MQEGEENIMKSVKLSILFAAAILLVACDNKNDGNTEPPVQKRVETILDIIDSKNGKPLQEVTLGKPVRLVLELKNLTNEMLSFNFSSGKQYDFEVHDSNNQLVWNWSYGRSFIQSFTTITLSPKEQIKFTPIWDLKDNGGSQVPLGTYQVTGLIPTIGPEIVERQLKSLTIKK